MPPRRPASGERAVIRRRQAPRTAIYLYASLAPLRELRVCHVENGLGQQRLRDDRFGQGDSRGWPRRRPVQRRVSRHWRARLAAVRSFLVLRSSLRVLRLSVRTSCLSSSQPCSLRSKLVSKRARKPTARWSGQKSFSLARLLASPKPSNRCARLRCLPGITHIQGMPGTSCRHTVNPNQGRADSRTGRISMHHQL